MADVTTKTRFRFKAPSSIGDGEEAKQYPRGYLTDDVEIPRATLDGMLENGVVEMVDIVDWEPEAHGGEGAWVARPPEEPAQPAPPTDQAKEPAGDKKADKVAAKPDGVAKPE